MTNSKKCFFILAILFVVINIVGLTALNTFEETRPIKLLTTIVFFALFLKFRGYKNKLLTLAFSFLIVSDSFQINFETNYGNQVTFIASIIAYTLIGIHFFSKIKGSQLKPYLLSFFWIINFIERVFNNKNNIND